MRPLRRWLAALAALAGSFGLAGCSFDATIEVTPDDLVTVDATARFVYGQDIPTAAEVSSSGENYFDLCAQLAVASWLVVTRTEYPAENAVTCRAVGRGPLTSIGDDRGALVHAGDRYVAMVGRSGAAMLIDDLSVASARPSVIRLRLPGAIESTDAAARVQGEVVTWTSSRQETGLTGLYASTVATDTGSRVLMVLAGSGGLAAGSALSLIALRLARRDADGAIDLDSDDIDQPDEP